MNVTIWVHLRRYCATAHDYGFELSSYSGLGLTAPSLLGAPRFRGSALDDSLFDQHQSTPPLATYISGLLRECVVYTISECLDSAQIVFWCIETQLPPHIMLPLL